MENARAGVAITANGSFENRAVRGSLWGDVKNGSFALDAVLEVSPSSESMRVGIVIGPMLLGIRDE